MNFINISPTVSLLYYREILYLEFAFLKGFLFKKEQGGIKFGNSFNF